jgi:superfamily II DNA or RNA helicase
MTLQELVATTGAQPRDYQERLITKTCGYYKDGIKSVLINSPTGSGKTIIGLLAARHLQQQHNIGIGWVAMRRNLLKQAAMANANMRIGCEGVRFISMFDHNPPTTDELGRPIKLLVVDECQHDSVSSMANLHNIIRPKWILGMTATPFRSDHVKLSFDKVIRDIGIQQLIAGGYLSQYHQFTLPRWDVEEVVNCYLREPERWGKSAIYFLTRDEANACCGHLQAAGVKAATIFGDQPMSEREEKLEQFERGDLQVLVNMVLLTEGWDSPSLKTVFVRDSQRGPTIQMAGRVFRKYKGIEFKQVVQSKMTHWPIQRTANPALACVWLPEEREWRSYAQSEAIEKVSMRVCITLAHIQTSMPAYIVKKTEKKLRHRRRQNDDGRANTESGLPRRDDSGLARGEANGWVGGFGGGAIIH